MMKLKKFLVAAVCFLPLIAQAAEPSTYTAPDAGSSLLKMTVGLLLVIAAIFGSAWVYRRFGQGAIFHQGNIRVIGGLSLGSRERIVLIQVGEEQILVGVSPGRIQTLHALEHNIEVEASMTTSKGGFQDKLTEAISQWKNK